MYIVREILRITRQTGNPDLTVWYCKVRIDRFKIAEPVQNDSGFLVKLTYISHITKPNPEKAKVYIPKIYYTKYVTITSSAANAGEVVKNVY